jgi:ribosomal protein S18 acetylase RimI-like enzyme
VRPIPSDGAPPAWLARRADANYRELFRAMARISPDGRVEEDGDLLLVRTGPLLPLFNAAIVKRVPAEPEALFHRATTFFAASSQRWALVAADDAADAMAATAANAGRCRDASPGMVLTPPVGAPPAPAGLRIEVVRDTAMLRTYNETMTAGFGNEWAAGAMLETNALLDVPDLVHYAGFVADVPVATAMRFISHRMAGVYNVSTVPEYRRRGIGEAMTWRAALDGLAEGCLASSLQASEMGLTMYRRMGYQTVTAYSLWLPP